MATIKAFTDISQSKKLAEILPIETADMKWYFWKSEIDAPKLPTFGYSKDAAESYKSTEAVYLPCWSLAALLDVLPHRIDDRHALVSGKLFANEGWYVCYDDDNGDIDYYVHNSSLIDACYEMIMKLHEQKLL